VTTLNLVSLERARLNLPNAQASDERTIDAMIGACSDAIQKWCKRDFSVRSYDELYNGNGDRRLLLRAYPLVSVESVRYRPVTAVKIINNSTSVNQQARVTVTKDGLTLLRVASGVRVVDTSVTFSANATLSALAAAVNALGAGWSAQVVGDSGQAGGQGDYGLWPSADLFVPQSFGSALASQGALTCRGQFAELKLHTYELAGYSWDSRGWLLRAIPYTDPELLHPEDLVWPVGINNFRVQYTAGYPEIPQAVQEACSEWVAELFALTQRDPALSRLSVPGALSQAWAPALAGEPPERAKALLAPYRRHSIAAEQS
jgi:hypothetical protein